MNYRILLLSLLVLSFLLSCSSDKNTNPNTTRINIDSVLIPAGTFQMGNTGAFAGLEDEKTTHQVTLTKSFYMGKYEVIQAQWKAIVGTDSSHFIGDSLPVEEVNFFDIVNFCNKLSDNNGFTKCYTINGTEVTCNWNANGWRLPTEAEWEYACKAGTTKDIYSGNITNSGCEPIDSNLGLIAWYCGNAGEKTHPVGQKQPNSFGLYDMSGNVYEWCWDWYGDYSNNPVTDPKGPDTGTMRVLRGSSWEHEANVCRSSSRHNHELTHRCEKAGFRIVRNQ
jgi:formylglycine-generating enzyme